MDTSEKRISHLLVKFLLETITEVERQELYEWINSSTENQAFFKDRVLSGVIHDKAAKNLEALLKRIDRDLFLKRFL